MRASVGVAADFFVRRSVLHLRLPLQVAPHGQRRPVGLEGDLGLEAIEALLAQYPERQPEISFQADRASLAMRRYLKRQAEVEN